MTLVRLKPAVAQSRAKHYTTEPLRSLDTRCIAIYIAIRVLHIAICFCTPSPQIRVLKWKLFFFFLNQYIFCGYSKESSRWDGTFEHPKHMFKLLRKLFLLNWTYVTSFTVCSGDVKNTIYSVLARLYFLCIWVNDTLFCSMTQFKIVLWVIRPIQISAWRRYLQFVLQNGHLQCFCKARIFGGHWWPLVWKFGGHWQI